MASNLVRKGFPLVTFDVNPAPVGQLVQLGARAALDCASLADDCDLVITMLPTSASVEQVLLGPEGVLARLRAGGAVMDMSTARQPRMCSTDSRGESPSTPAIQSQTMWYVQKLSPVCQSTPSW